MNTQTPEPRVSDYAPMRLVYPTDIVGKALTYSLNEPVEPQRQNLFADAIGQQGVEAGWWIAALCMLMLTLINLIIGWYTEDSLNWSWYWSFAFDALLAQVFILWGIWYTRREARARPDGVKTATQVSVRSLRRAALAGDDNLAPPVTDLIETPAAPSPNATLSAFTVLPPEWRLLRRLKIGIGICIGICVLPGVAQLVVYAGGGTLSLVLLGFVLPSLILCLWQFVPIVRRSRSFSVDARADGLHWQKHALPWSEVRGWFVFSLQLQNTRWTHPNTIYALVGQHASLTWLTYPPEIESQDPGKRLAELVQAHVSLPLRDLTPGAICISEDIGGRLFANTFQAPPGKQSVHTGRRFAAPARRHHDLCALRSHPARWDSDTVWSAVVFRQTTHAIGDGPNSRARSTDGEHAPLDACRKLL